MPNELLIYAFTLLASLAGIVKLVLTLITNSANRASAAIDALNAELRADFDLAQETVSKAQTRITELEKQRVTDLALITKLTEQVSILLDQMSTMQQTVRELQEQLELERRNNEQLIIETKRLTKQNDDLCEANKLLKQDNKTMREMIALLGLRLAEGKSGPPTTSTGRPDDIIA